MSISSSVAEKTNIPRRYIDDGSMQREIVLQQIPLYEHMSFINYDYEISHCTILLAGLEPDQETNLQRNVNTIPYNKQVTEVILTDNFDFVETVSTVLSNDDEFDIFVHRKGGTVIHPTFWDIPITWAESFVNYCHWHPDIDGCLSQILRKPDTSSDTVIPSSLTTRDFFNDKFIIWFLNESSVVMTANGRMLLGTAEIITFQTELDPALSIVYTPLINNGPSHWALICQDAEFFNANKYKRCVWS